LIRATLALLAGALRPSKNVFRGPAPPATSLDSGDDSRHERLSGKLKVKEFQSRREVFTARLLCCNFSSVHCAFGAHFDQELVSLPTLSDSVDALSKVFALVTSTTASSLISLIGLLLILVSILIGIVAVTKPQNMQPWHKWMLFVALIGGMAFSAAGPSLALFNITENLIPRVPKDQALDNLAENARIGWLIRLIPFDPNKEAFLSIDNLKTLGPAKQRFTFVAPYNELKGISVKDAITSVGGTYSEGQHVSAIIFPLPLNETLYPANARGLLQVVSIVENDLPTGKFLLKDTNELDNADRVDLENKAIWSWRYGNYKNRYAKYCRLTHKLRCNKDYAARPYIGGLNYDWHPLGVSQSVTSDPCALSVDELCASADWKKQKESLVKNFGSRVFLLRNMDIKDIPGRLLIDFNNPQYQRIPEIGLR
jgi:hypothetical protein